MTLFKLLYSDCIKFITYRKNYFYINAIHSFLLQTETINYKKLCKTYLDYYLLLCRYTYAIIKN